MALEIHRGITVDAGIRFGKPCLAGTRLDAATVLGALAAGQTFEAVAADYQITRQQILDALGFAAHLASYPPPAVH